jgi:hypothetical protein
VAGYLSPTPEDADDTDGEPDEPLPVDDDGYVDAGDDAGEQEEGARAAVGDEAPWWRSR